MCLIVKGKPKAKTAGKDIVCYKIIKRYVGDKYRTPFVEEKVEIGETYHLPTSFLYGAEEEYLHTVVRGGAFHSITNKADAVKNARDMNGSFHIPLYGVAKCVIPKGSKYVRGMTYRCFSTEAEAIVSDTIKYVKLISI